METGRPPFSDEEGAEAIREAGEVSQDPEVAIPEGEGHSAAETAQAAEKEEDDFDYYPTDPDEQVEVFLQDCSDIFAEGQRQWRSIRRLQGEILQSQSLGFKEALKEGGINRAKRREPAIRKLVEGDWPSLIMDTQKRAENYYIDTATYHWDKKHPGDEEGQRQCLEQTIKNYPAFPIPEDFPEDGSAPIRLLNELYGTVLRAYHSDEIAFDRIDAFLKTADPEAVKALIDRIESLADDEFQGRHEFPGLLESWAVHIRRSGVNSLLAQAVKQIAPPTEEFGADFIASVIDNHEEGRRTDLTTKFMLFGAKVAMGITLEEEPEDWRTDLAERFTRQVGNWPPELTKELSLYAVRRQNTRLRDLTQKLEKYIHEGRAGRMRLSSAGTKKRLGTAPPSQPSASTQTEAILAEAIISEKVKTIERFATFKNSGQSQSTRNQLITVEYRSIAELMETRFVADYIKKHQADTSLADNLRRALTQLVETPFDHTLTRRLVGVKYLLDQGDSRPQRHLRRMSLQRLSGVPRSSISSKTRILYDVLDNNGEPQLVLYGVFIKQDIENINELPRR